MGEYLLINRPIVSVYEEPCKESCKNGGQPLSNRSDEGLYGNAGRILEGREDWLYMISAYGYAGYVQQEEVLVIEEEDLADWISGAVVTMGSATDILTAPTVHGICMMTLSRGSVVKYLGEAENGWAKVGLPDGREGYTAAHRLMQKRYGEDLLWEDTGRLLDAQLHAGERKLTERGGRENFSFQALLDRFYQGSESAFREELTAIAQSYLGTQYRWAGRGSSGIDCSGLAQISYLLCGVAIYRDAAIVQGYPLQRLNLPDMDPDAGSYDDLRPGDTLYFPGHVALYLGDGMYLHSTGKAGDLGVVINSLQPGHERYREDLHKSLYAAAGLRL